MYQLRGKSAIITGSARGFGREFALRFLRAGMKVCISDVMEDVGDETLKELAREFGEDKVLFVKCDVTKEEEWEELWKKAEDKFGYISILINNAGVNPNMGWKMCLNIMLWGQFIGTHLAMEKMSTKKGGKGGRIINTASIAGMIVGFGGIEWAGYNAAKFGNVAFTRLFGASNPSLYETDGVKSYAICPNLANTRLVGTEEQVKFYEKKLTYRALTIEEVGEALMKSLDKDKNGACYVVHPDVPLLDVPNGTGQTVMWYITIGTILKKMNVDIGILDTRAVIAVSAALILIGFYVLRFALCLFC